MEISKSENSNIRVVTSSERISYKKEKEIIHRIIIINAIQNIIMIDRGYNNNNNNNNIALLQQLSLL